MSMHPTLWDGGFRGDAGASLIRSDDGSDAHVVAIEAMDIVMEAGTRGFMSSQGAEGG